ncbi:hypothetical protein JCM3774_006319 [Rhodotorula dairenensis]
MALRAPVNAAMPVAGPSVARARLGAPIERSPAPPHRKRLRKPTDADATITISSDSEDYYEDPFEWYNGSEVLLPPRKGRFARNGGRNVDDGDVEVVAPAPVAGPARKEPLQREQAAPQAGPAPAAAVASPFEQAVAAVVGILPDISRSHLKAELLRQPAYGPADIEAVLEAFLSAPGGYPKEEFDVAHGVAAREGKGKGRAVEPEHEHEPAGGGLLPVGNTIDEDDEIERTALAWLDTAKRGWKGTIMYREAALDQLAIDFPLVRLPDLRSYFAKSSSLYAQTFIALSAVMELPVTTRGIKMLASARSNKGKGRQKQDDDFDREREWVTTGLPKWRALQCRKEVQEKLLKEEIKSGAFFECGCCFGETAFSRLITCSEGCQFCPDCVRGIADNEIGLRKYVLKCMATDGCTATFPESELVKCLPRKTLGALHKIKQEKEVDEAGIEGLAKCPFCPFAMIIENPNERLFHCHRPDCRIISCRDCGKRDHLPKTCAEVTDSELKLKSVHHVEEAMTEALIRRCPKAGCGEPYVKESGTCNKVRCSNCGTLSCYICNKIIEGYQHFKNPGSNLPMGLKADANATCALWDDTDSRNFQEVEAARVAAEAEARRLHAEVELKDDDFANLKMAKPPAPGPKIGHLEPPQVPGLLLGRAGNRAGAAAPAAAGPVMPRYPRGALPPPAPAKPPPRMDHEAVIVEARRLIAIADAQADQRRLRAVEEIKRMQEQLDKADRAVAEARNDARELAAAAVRRAGAPPNLPPLRRQAGQQLKNVIAAAAQAGPSGARSPAGHQRDAAPGVGAGQTPGLQVAARKRAAEVDAAREAKRARLSGARQA